MKKRIAVVTLCVFMISIFAGVAMAKNEKSNYGQLKSHQTWGNGQVKHLLDIDNDWAKTDIEEATTKGFVRGYEDGTYQPNKPVTCLETIVILIRVAGLEDEVEDYDLTNLDLTTLKKIPDWAKAYVAVALEEGILTENEIKTFNPNQGAKRYQVCLYMQNVLDKFNISVVDEEFVASFIDSQWIPQHARKSISNMARFGVINGYPDGSFSPMRVVKRNEIAKMINYLDNNCVQAYVLKGTLDKVQYDNDNEVLKLSVIDNNDEESEIRIYQEDDVDIYYDGYKLAFDEELEDIEAGGAILIQLNEDKDPVWIKISAPADTEDYVVLRGTLNQVDYDDQDEVLTVKVIDNQSTAWTFAITEEDDVDIYYGDDKLDFDEELEDILPGSSIRMLLNEDQDPVWIKISAPADAEDYVVLRGTLNQVDYDDQDEVLTVKVIDSQSTSWTFEITEEDDVDVYYDGSKLVLEEDLEDIEAGGAIRILLNEDEDPIWIKISLPD